MSWGKELWDQYETLFAHSQKGIDFLEKYGQFIRDRCQIELEYAGKLRRLVKNHQPKKKDEEDYQYSPCRAFKSVMNEMNDLAGQHEVIAENLQCNIIREVNVLVKDCKEERKKHLHEGARLITNLNTQIAALERTRRNYEKTFKEAEKAVENFQKADADYNLSRAEVEKQRMNMVTKTQLCDESRNEYAYQLQKTNDLQAQHYHILMPEIFQHLQELDEKRIKNIKNFMLQSVDIERNVFPIISQCLDGIVAAAENINEKEDTLLVIERYKSGFQPPTDIPFEDLSAIKSGEQVPVISSLNAIPVRPEAVTVKGTMSASKLKKRVGIFNIFSSSKNAMSPYGENKEDYSDLPPNQRKKRLQQRLDDIAAKIQQETAAREGLMKMKGVYEQNPSMGNPMTIEGQLSESSHVLDKLRTEQYKFQQYLEEAQAMTMTQDGSNMSPSAPSRRLTNGGGNRRNNRHSGGSGGEEESLSRSASDSSVANNKQSTPGTPLPSHHAESGLGVSRTSLPDSEEHDHGEFEVDSNSVFFSPKRLPTLGMCRALYAFDASNDGSISMHQGEELDIIEFDQGDGWTRVRRKNENVEGFVPTTYIDCTIFQS